MRFLIFISVILIFLASCAGGNKHSFNKSNRKYYKWRYAKTIRKPKKVCRTVTRNRKSDKSIKVRASGNGWKENNVYALAEVDNPSEYTTAITTKPKPSTPSTPEKTTSSLPEKTTSEKPFEEKSFSEQNQIQDDVLEKSHLPKPTSQKHAEIRSLVEKKLKTHKDGDPIKLEPLYFTFDDAEFAVVDMEPFLIAAEYALHGRMVLIEGHTDSQGIDDYNVELSIKRVEKIRQLMQDMGVPDERISVVGYGEEVAIHDNTTHEGRQLNRRVDFTIF